MPQVYVFLSGVLKLDDQTLVHRVNQLICTLLLRTLAETIECVLRTVEDGDRRRFGMDVNQSLSQSTKCIPLTAHKAPELKELQTASYVRVR